MESLDNFKEGDLITIIWDAGDNPISAQVIGLERGFVIYLDLDTKEQGVFRPASPYKIQKAGV